MQPVILFIYSQLSVDHLLGITMFNTELDSVLTIQ